MPDSHLPDDLAAWPSDPFKLLGIAPSADATELRRAYNALVRIYRADDHPREFEAVRKAYEQALQWSRWNRRDNAEPAPADRIGIPTTEESPRDAERAEPAAPNADSDRPEATLIDSRPRSVRPFADRLDAAWSAGRDGDVEECLRLLKSLRDERPNDPEPYLRLYWLHRLSSELASRKAPVEWLMEGLAATALSPRLMPAYLDELQHSPLFLLEEHSKKLLAIEAPEERLFEFARGRWPAAARLHEWTIIQNDLDVLRPKLSIDAPDDWIRLLMFAMDHAIWSGLTAGRELADRCRRELSEFTDRELALSDEYERLAFLFELASDSHLQDGSTVPANLRSLLRKSWVASDAELRCEFLELVAGWVDAPDTALDVVTNLATHSPVGLMQLWRTVHRAPIPWEMHPSAERRAMLAHRVDFFLGQVVGASYEDWRKDFLRFCLNELIWPEEMAEWLSQSSGVSSGDEVATAIQQDIPLRCVYRACLAFLAEAG